MKVHVAITTVVMSSRSVPHLVGSTTSSYPIIRRRLHHSAPKVYSSSESTFTTKFLKGGAPYNKLEEALKVPERSFQRLSTATLVRSVVLGQIFNTPILFRPCLYLMKKIANSKSAIFNADKNPLIRMVVHPLIYKHFCAGRNKAEVQQTIADIKMMGYSGVILCYSKEVMARTDPKAYQTVEKPHDEELTRREIEEWRDGNLTTLSAVGEGDYIGVKYTGAGPTISHALKEGKEPPQSVRQALYDICDQAKSEQKRLWIDAEQQVYHPTIDKWTVDLMRKYNRDGRVLVLTTIQSYLKCSREIVEWYMRQAQAEGWTLGMKLVRGAYIGSDIRSRIHDTKADTDASYNGIAYDILTKSWPNFDKSNFPPVQIFLAGHNTDSIRRAATLAQRLAHAGELSQTVHYGQLQGMADDIGCELLALGDQAKDACSKAASKEQLQRTELGAPSTYKCLTWGSIQDCLHYLVRRVIENQSAVERMNAGLGEMKSELRRRFLKL